MLNLNDINKFISNRGYLSNPCIENYVKQNDFLLLESKNNSTIANISNKEIDWLKRYDLIFYVCFVTFIENKETDLVAIESDLIKKLIDVILEIEDGSYSNQFKFYVSFSLITSELHNYVAVDFGYEKLKDWAKLCYSKNKSNQLYKLNRILYLNDNQKKIKKLIEFFKTTNPANSSFGRFCGQDLFLEYYFEQFYWSNFYILNEFENSLTNTFWSFRRNLLFNYISYKDLNI